jgi:hypothetical protein
MPGGQETNFFVYFVSLVRKRLPSVNSDEVYAFFQSSPGLQSTQSRWRQNLIQSPMPFANCLIRPFPDRHWRQPSGRHDRLQGRSFRKVSIPPVACLDAAGVAAEDSHDRKRIGIWMGFQFDLYYFNFVSAFVHRCKRVDWAASANRQAKAVAQKPPAKLSSF